MENIYVKAVSEALIERAKAEATVAGLLKKIAEKKRRHLAEVIQKQKPYESKGFVLVRTSYDICDWNNSGFSVSADFILKDVEIPSNATAREIKLLKEYKNLIKDVDWSWIQRERGIVDEASEINRKLCGLKNEIEVYIGVSWSYKLSDIQREDIFTRGFSFERRGR